MVRNRKGFTLIELLIVVVIIGILAAIAIPKFANTKEKAYIAAMKSDLRNMATAEESYFSDVTPSVYASTLDLGTRFNSSSGVTVTATPNSGLGWAAHATHTATGKSCVMYVGTPVAVPTLITLGTQTIEEGEPVCDASL